MTSKAKAKGNSWELEIAKFLSSLYNESFIRAPGSGAYIGGQNTARKQFLDEGKIRSFKGDIIPGESFPKFNAEAKNYKELPFHQLIAGDCKQFDQWLDQLMDVADAGDLNLLMVKITRKGKFIAVEEKNFFVLKTPNNYVKYNNAKLGTWYIMDFDAFWSLNADAVKQLCQ